MVPHHIHILGGDHDPPYPFVIVDRDGRHVDLSKVVGQLWDEPTVSEIEWGRRATDGRVFGVVRFKNGQPPRTFWDGELMLPYLRAWKMKKADDDLKIALAEAAAKED